MKVISVTEARMTSTRLPGKVLMKSAGKPMLVHMLKRLQRSKALDDVVLATTVNVEDDPVVKMCEEHGFHYFRGSEDDVLLRVIDAAKAYDAELIVETTGDCPLIDWRHVDRLVDIYMSGKYDFVSNCTKRTFPDGFDIRIFSTKLLEELNEISDDPTDHEHVAIYFPRHPEKYKCYNLEAEGIERRPDIEVTLDEMGDYKLIDSVFNGLYAKNPDFSCKDVIQFIDNNKELLEYVKNIKRKY